MIMFILYKKIFLKSTDTKHRSMPGITLGTSNKHGGHLILILYSRKSINSHKWDELSIIKEALKRVEGLRKKDKKPKMKDRYSIFER